MVQAVRGRSDRCKPSFVSFLLFAVAGITFVALVAVLLSNDNTSTQQQDSLLSSTSKIKSTKENAIMPRTATFVTSMGTFKAELYTEQMPITCGNFIDLANGGFYDNVHFHRVIPNVRKESKK